ncbi:MAG: hypothetical protein RQ731_02515 [Anaerosomatales bacterium]|nr:hypothetical protein [Anaerosomatales bacterium]MDT8433617.1 hypothetical protein [Anaerosomatales bacterium]
MESLAIAEIAGRDSVAAAVAAVREHGFTRLLPTIALTGTETGDRRAPLRAIDTLAGLLGDACEVLEPITLSDPALWAAMNARHAAVIRSRYGSWSPCLACHLYLHLLRVPVSWDRGNAPVIAGERDSHDGRIKLSQLPAGIDSSIRVLAHAGVELIEPIRHASGADVADIVGAGWEQDGGQLGCVLSGNYVELDGSVRHDEAAYERYVSGFFEPVGNAIVDAWRARRDGGATPDYAAIVGAILAG